MGHLALRVEGKTIRDKLRKSGMAATGAVVGAATGAAGGAGGYVYERFREGDFPSLFPPPKASLLPPTAPSSFLPPKGGDRTADATKNNLPPGDTKGQGSTRIRTSYDPNDIIGPASYGTQNWLSPNATLPYTIRFENQATATAPAVLVNITQQLDADLDLSTFRLGDFGFGNIYIDVPDGFQSYSTRLDLRSTIGDFVDFTASLDPNTRTVTWQLIAIDPATGELSYDVDAGFLPPNNANHDGEGFVSYRVNAKPGLPTGTVIDAQARIVFDYNDPINTPAIFNTVDVGKPTSTVNALPATTSNSTFTVSWSGTDDGSGIASYDVYVSVDGGAFTLWQDDITTTSAQYSGAAGRTYGFFAIAKDNVGNSQAIPTSAQATTRVSGTATPSISISDATVVEGLNPQAVFTVTLSAPSSQTVTVTYSTANGTAISGSDFTNATNTLTFAANETSKTINIPILNDNTNESNESFTIILNNPTNATIADGQGTGTITDTLITNTTTVLPNGVENLTLTGTASIDGTGNSGNNIITGNSANNRLNGGAGTDALIGGAGDDTYIIDTLTDTITEAANGGTDAVESSITFNLATTTIL